MVVVVLELTGVVTTLLASAVTALAVAVVVVEGGARYE